MRTNELTMSDNVRLPVSAGTETVAVLGRRGSGKSNTGTVLLEELLDAGQQVVLIDPKGEGWGLKAKGGGGPGYPVIVFGEPQGDLPLKEEHGELLADFAVDSGRSVVLSLAGFASDAAERRLVQAFCERLYRRKMRPGGHSPLMVVLEEAHLFVPQRVDAAQTGVVRAVQRLVRQGRSAGVGVTLVDQRPASVNKDVLTQLGLMVCHQLTSPQDRSAVAAWVEAQDDEGRAAEFLDSLAGLEPGEAWVWSPGAKVFARTRVRRRKTFDSGSTPVLGKESKGAAKVEWADVNLDALRAQLDAVVKEREANDPAALKRRVAELERELQKAAKGTPGAVPPGPAKVVEKPVVLAKDLAAIEKLVGRLNLVVGQQATAIEELQARQKSAQEHADAVVAAARSIESAVRLAKAPAAPASVGGPPTPQPRPPRTTLERIQAYPKPTAAAAPAGERPEGFAPAHQRLLDALAWLASFGLAAPDRGVVAAVAGASPSSSSFANNLGRLSAWGLVAYPAQGAVALTDAGRPLAAA
ncbi:MAG TPA: helicase HerA-like domain-containing protein, partial [Humisphaera sp.]